MKDRQRIWNIALSALGLAALGALFIVWLLRRPYPLYARAAALLSAGLFAVLGLRFVPRWTAFWSEGEEPPAPDGNEPRHMGPKLFGALLLADALVLLMSWPLRNVLGHPETLLDALRSWRCADGVHYLDIAREWYLSEGSVDRLVQLVFLPGYPLLVRLLLPLTGSDLAAGLLVSALCFAAGGAVFYRLLRLDLPHAQALRGVALFCLLPGSFFFAAPMSESLFFLLCVLCLYLARAGRTGLWWLGCLCGAMAAFTRSLGLMLFVPLLLELGHEFAQKRLSLRRLALRAPGLLLVPAGFGVYCYVNYTVSGDPFRFLVYQGEHWGQHLGLFFNTAAYQTELAVSTCGREVVLFSGLWLPNLLCSFGALALLALTAKRLRASYTAWAMAYYVIAMGATWLLSAPRYLAALPVLPLALTIPTEKRWAGSAAFALLAITWILYYLAFLARWQVW